MTSNFRNGKDWQERDRIATIKWIIDCFNKDLKYYKLQLVVIQKKVSE